MKVAKINAQGVARVLDGKPGMTFVVDCFTDGLRGPVAHVRDYRYPGPRNNGEPFQIWSIAADGYELIEN